MHNDVVKAQLGVSQEWASMPVLADTTRNGKVIKKGYKYHGGSGINKGGYEPEKMRKVNQFLVDAKKCIWETRGTANDIIALTQEKAKK